MIQIYGEVGHDYFPVPSLFSRINTAEEHSKNIYTELRVTSRIEAIHWWLEKGTDFRN